MKNPAIQFKKRKESVQSGTFRRQHALVHVSPFSDHAGCRGTYMGGGGGGMYFRGIAANSNFQ